ncbi:MAG: tail fiber domain-containing protein [Limisphaerales bacterium]
MKKNHTIAGWLMLLALSTFNLQPSTAQAQGTAFTYQGQLQNNGSPASGTYNLTFSLFDTATSGVAVAGPVTNNGVLVSNGLFTVLIDFGPGVFTGATNWLEIAVATNRASTFTMLTPRQQLTPTPYAIYAESASGLNGTLSASQLTSLGNTNGGSGNFFVGPSGNSTTSGGNNTANGVNALYFNTTGSFNTANGDGALFSNTGGSANTANGYGALIANTSGNYNTANGDGALSGNTSGSGNTANGGAALYNNQSGSYNIALGYQAGLNITTGSSNIDIGNSGVTGDNSIIRIGSGQTQTFIAGVINGNGGGLTNLIVSAAQLTSVGNTNGGSGNFFVGSSGNASTSGSFNSGFSAALDNNASGSDNTAEGWGAMENNTSGSDNTANGFIALYGNRSGSDNIALGSAAGYYITTGSSNIDIGNEGVAGDNNIIRIGSGQGQTFIAGVINGNGGGLTNLNVPGLVVQPNADGAPNVVAGSPVNFVGSGVVGATISGGGATNYSGTAYTNSVTADFGAVGGGAQNAARGARATVGGGLNNTASSFWATVGGGYDNTASGENATVGGGVNNTASSFWATVGGGVNNIASSGGATVGGGEGNSASGGGATVPGGSENVAGGEYSFAAGYNADAANNGAFVWSDGTGTPTASTVANQFVARASGGFVFYSSTGSVGATLAAGGGSWSSLSDRNAKDHLTPVNSQTVLAQVAALPLTTWSYKTEPGVRHVGPMAQDFYNAFGVGEDDKHITEVDEGGVALAAIQGLNQKLEETRGENAHLKARLEKLERLLNQRSGGGDEN